ncbi:hypothetical protein F5Y07DRAFT_360257 [Xylaria sp. FL0933]|nr:hypothetical protein F5Y07DRAFT_360257 [Xylaria sp. FL0933]
MIAKQANKPNQTKAIAFNAFYTPIIIESSISSFDLTSSIHFICCITGRAFLLTTMASLAQIGLQPAQLHCWRTPGHYLHCQDCRNYRSLQSRAAEAEASHAGRVAALSVGTPYRFRRLAISTRLEDPRLRALYNSQLDKEGLGPRRRHVTIQIPSLAHPVRPDESPRPPLVDQVSNWSPLFPPPPNLSSHRRY